MSTSKSGLWRRVTAASLSVGLVAVACAYYLQASPAAVLAQSSSGAGSAGYPAPSLSSGPGVSRPGILLDVRPTSAGAVEVVETVQLRRPVDRIRLRAPRVGRAGSDFADLTPVATSVELSIDGQPADVPEEVGSDPTQVYLPLGTTAYTVRYLLEDATVRDQPAAGQALVAVGPLSAAGPAGRINLLASGDAVLDLTCPLLAGNAAACGTPADDGFQLRTPLRGPRALVLVQVDLPEP